MADVYEKVESRERSDTEERRIYIVTGTNDAAVAQAAVLAFAPATAGGFTRQAPRVTPAYVDEADEPACVWESEVMYQNSPDVKPLAVGEKRSQIQIGASGTLHITSVPYTDHIADYGVPGEVVYSSNGLLGWNGQDILGADRDAPTFHWSETHVLANATVTDAYVLGIVGVRFKAPINETIFRGFQPGEVKLCGISGGAREDQDVELTFDFEARPNVVEATYGDVGWMNTIAVEGWQNVTIEYRLKDNPVAGKAIPVACSVHIDRLYAASDFGVLGIGTGGSPIFPGL